MGAGPSAPAIAGSSAGSIIYLTPQEEAEIFNLVSAKVDSDFPNLGDSERSFKKTQIARDFAKFIQHDCGFINGYTVEGQFYPARQVILKQKYRWKYGPPDKWLDVAQLYQEQYKLETNKTLALPPSQPLIS